MINYKFRRKTLIFNKDELAKLIKEKGIKSTDDFNSFMRDVSKVSESYRPVRSGSWR